MSFMKISNSDDYSNLTFPLTRLEFNLTQWVNLGKFKFCAKSLLHLHLIKFTKKKKEANALETIELGLRYDMRLSDFFLILRAIFKLPNFREFSLFYFNSGVIHFKKNSINILIHTKKNPVSCDICL